MAFRALRATNLVMWGAAGAMGVKMTDTDDQSLTGVWHGLYGYDSHPHIPESAFVCIMIDNGGRLSGSITETMARFNSAPVDAFAFIDGAHCSGQVTFLKTYDGSGGQTHGVSYAGILSGDREEIEGEWRIDGRYGVTFGHFLMIRSRPRATARTIEAEAHEKAH